MSAENNFNKLGCSLYFNDSDRQLVPLAVLPSTAEKDGNPKPYSTVDKESLRRTIALKRNTLSPTLNLARTTATDYGRGQGSASQKSTDIVQMSLKIGIRVLNYDVRSHCLN